MDNLWNVDTRLSPKGKQYSSESYKFKKTPKNLDLIHKEELEKKSQEKIVAVLRKKSED